MQKPILLIHGGASSRSPSKADAIRLEVSLAKILEAAYQILLKGGSATEAVVRAVELLENDPLYNAGYGSKLQEDGKIRMSASLMNGSKLRFSGALNVQNIKNPIKLAQALQLERDRVLDPDGAKKFAKEHKINFGSNYTPERKREWQAKKKGKSGTVGAVALDSYGCLAAATSTGGKGHEVLGRVSDSPTIAGNYANDVAAISATGIGEEIVSDALAAAIATRCADGHSLKIAVERSFQKGRKRGVQYGCICVDKKGKFYAITTTPFMAWGVIQDKKFFVSPARI